jgi:hypothetical protein
MELVHVSEIAGGGLIRLEQHQGYWMACLEYVGMERNDSSVAGRLTCTASSGNQLELCRN